MPRHKTKSKSKKKKKNDKIGVKQIRDYVLTHVSVNDDGVYGFACNNKDGEQVKLKRDKLTNPAIRHLKDAILAAGIDVDILEQEAQLGVYYFIPRAAELFAIEDDVTELGVAESITASRDVDQIERCTVNVEIGYIIVGLDDSLRFIDLNCLAKRIEIIKHGCGVGPILEDCEQRSLIQIFW